MALTHTSATVIGHSEAIGAVARSTLRAGMTAVLTAQNRTLMQIYKRDSFCRMLPKYLGHLS